MPASRHPTTENYAFETLVEGVWFGRARPEGTALSNTGIIDLGDSTLVFDTSLTLRAARDTRQAARALTGRAPSLIVNSHWHLDHVLGNQLFEDGTIHATRRTIEILLEKREELLHEICRERLEAEVRELEAQRATTGSEAGRARYDAVLRTHRTLLEETLERKLTAPTEGFARELTLPGDQPVRAVTFGAGHTESDAVLHLPRSGVLFAGDLIVLETHPNLTSGDPEHWLIVLDEIERLRPERIVTGHGPVGTVDALGTMRDYLETVLELAREPAEPPIPARFRAYTEPEMFAANVSYARSRVGTPP